MVPQGLPVNEEVKYKPREFSVFCNLQIKKSLPELCNFLKLSPHYFKSGHCGRLLRGRCTASGTESKCGLLLPRWNMLLAATYVRGLRVSQGLVESRSFSQGLAVSRRVSQCLAGPRSVLQGLAVSRSLSQCLASVLLNLHVFLVR